MLVELTQNEVAALATIVNDKAAKEKSQFAKAYLEELGKKLEKAIPEQLEIPLRYQKWDD